MALNKYKLGELIEQYLEKNKDEKYTIESVRGISTQKMFISTKADMENVSLKNYKIVPPNHFAYVPDTSRRGNKISLAFNDTDDAYLVSSISIVFKVNQEKLLPEYLFMYFNRSEFDRYSRFNSWGSAREPFNYYDMCDIEIELPSIEIQKKYVAIYKSMLLNQKKYEKDLTNFKMVCDGYIEEIKKKYICEKLRNYIIKRNEKNSQFTIKKLVGVGMEGFIEPKQSKDETNGHICYKVYKNDIVFAPPQVHKGAIALWNNDEIVKCSDAYAVFYVNSKSLDINYLMMLLTSPFFQKYAYFYRDGVREQLSFEQLCEYEISIPPLTEQKSIVNIYNLFIKRKQISDKLKEQIKNVCPILIKGSLEEAKCS